MVYYMSEVMNYCSFREATKLQATTFDEAKKEAESLQAFCGTTLYLGYTVDERGFIPPYANLAYKVKETGKWVEIEPKDIYNEN